MNSIYIRIQKSIGLQWVYASQSLFLIIMLLFVAQVRAQDETNLTMAGAINMALNENPYLSSQEASLEAEKANIALDEGRMKKESRLLDRSEKLKRRSKRVLEREEYRIARKAGFGPSYLRKGIA